MSKQRYLDCVLEHKGHALYESEIHPSVVSEVMGYKITGRSMNMSPEQYTTWMNVTGMDMQYIYVPWSVGRKETIDNWGIIRWENGYFTAADLRKDPPYETMKRRLDNILRFQGDWGIEYAIYSAPMILQDGLGLEKFMLLAYDDPDLLDSYLKAINEKVSLEIEIVSEYPIDAIQMSNILAEKNGPICNDEQMERFNLKYLRGNVQHIKARGKIATLHCDGKLDKLYQRLIEAGFQCINGYDSNKFEEDLRQWGNQIAMRGCISMDHIARDMTIGQMRTAVAHAKSLPSHVIGSTHDFPENRPAQFVAMIEEFNH